MALAALGILLGEVVLAFALSQALFAAYSRGRSRLSWRVILLLLPVLVLASPLALLAVGWHPIVARHLCIAAAGVGIAVGVHFLFPYKWGIKKVREAHYPNSTREIGEGVVLRDCVVERPDLPVGCDRLTMLVLSDLHCTSSRKLQTLKESLHTLAHEEWDIVLALGDLGESPDLLPHVIKAIAAVPSRYGTFCVRGNHDFEGGRADLIEHLLAKYGIILLSNDVHHLPDTELSLLGLEAPWERALPTESLSDRFVLGLTHMPDNIRLLERLDVNVGVAGHTHGGRLRVPYLGSLWVPSRLGRFLDQGLFTSGDSAMYVTAGLSYFLARMGKPGEILRLTLTRPASARLPA